MNDINTKRILDNKEQEEDVILNLSLRPNKIKDFVGQKEVIENLSISIQAAKDRDEPLEHILFSGPQGLGKTTLAHIIAREMNAKITATSGPAIERAGDLIGILTNLEKDDILFIDEIHRLSKVIEEFLYPAMESFQIDFIIDKGPYAKTIKFNLKPFTLIGATTRTGLLSSPLRARFGIFHHLNFYSDEELVRIINRSSKLLDVYVEEDAYYEIAKRARGTPRVANRLLRRVRDYAQVKADGKITKDLSRKGLELQGVDEMGLDNMDRKVLLTIIDVYKGGPVGIESLAATLNEEVDTIVDVIEPYLLKSGFIKRTQRGRETTELAFKYFNKSSTQEQKRLF